MKLIVLYGPPGAGKLTVSRELYKITGYGVFHSCLTRDLLGAVLGSHNDELGGLLFKYRAEFIELAARNKIKGLIFTFGYSNTRADKAFVRKITSIVERGGGHIYFVQLLPSISELRRRVREPSRRRYDSKAKTVRELERNILKHDMFTPIGSAKSLNIDNTNISARRVAKIIKSTYKL